MSMSVVDRIREQMERRDGVSGESMEPLTMSYGLEVGQANDRLGVCVNLLRKGLRSEAIQQANMRPNLIEWCARLDFPEIEDWFEILQFFQVPLPRALNRDAVRQLQEALVEEQPLEELLRQHRRMAIGKAPIAWRLRVLRRIATVDSANSVWTEDVEVWEKARLREIPTELEAAIKSSNLNVCNSLAKELGSNTWRIQPPSDVVKYARLASDRLEHATHCDELRIIATAMSDAFCAHDESACRDQRTAWLTLVDEMTQPPLPEIVEVAEHALLWLEERDAAAIEDESRLQAVADLEVAIDQAESVLALQKAYSNATRFNQPLDLKLESRYRGVLSELQLRGKRKAVLRVASVVSVALLGLIAFGVWQWHSVREREVNASVTALTQLLEENKLSEAQQYLDGLVTGKPHVVENAAVGALASDLTGRLQAEAERFESFSKYVEQADNEKPELIDLSILQNAEKLASTEPEKGTVFRVRQRREAYDRVVENQQFQELKAEIVRLTKEVDDLEAKDLMDLPDSALERTLLLIDDLRRKFPKAGSGGISLIDALTKRTNSLRVTVRQATLARQSEFNALKLIREASSLQSLAQALSNFGFQAPESALASEFEEVSKESKYWQRTHEWNEFTDAVGGYLRNHDAAVVPELLSKLTALEQSVSANPVLAAAPKVRVMLEKIAARGAIMDKLTSELDKDIRSSLLTLEAPSRAGLDPLRFFAYSSYVTDRKSKDKLQSAGSKGLEVLAASDGTVANTTMSGVVVVRQEPQKLYNELIGNFGLQRNAFLEKWEAKFLDEVATVFKRPELDHKIKEQLILQLLRAAAEGSDFLSDRQQENLVFLGLRETKNKTDWFEIAKPQALMAAEVTEQINPTLSKTMKDLRLVDAPLQAVAASKLQWVGTVQRDVEGQPQAVLAKQPKTNGKLYVIRQQVSTGDVSALVFAGKVRDGNSTLSGDRTQLVLGRPLFFWATDAD